MNENIIMTYQENLLQNLVLHLYHLFLHIIIIGVEVNFKLYFTISNTVYYILIIERLVSNNLIDLNCEAPPPPTPHIAHNYVNDFVVGNKNHNSQPRDVFDMRMLLK